MILIASGHKDRQEKSESIIVTLFVVNFFHFLSSIC